MAALFSASSPARVRAFLRGPAVARAVAIARSLVIALVLAVCVLRAMPGKPITKGQLAAPVNAQPIAATAGMLSAVGIDLSSQALGELVLSASKRLAKARRVLLKPFHPILDELSIDQRWGLFVSRGSHGYQIQLEAMRADQRWHVIYRAHELDEHGLEPQLSYRRLRGIYNPHHSDELNEQYEALVHALAAPLLASHPEYVGIRASMQRLRLGTRERPNAVESVGHVCEVFRPGTP